MRIATIFPGQGAQSVGMLAEASERSPIVEQRFAEASEALSFDLWQLTQEGPAEVLGQTENTQPALLTASVALWEVLQSERADEIQAEAMAGHSLGSIRPLFAQAPLPLSTLYDWCVSAVSSCNRLCPMVKVVWLPSWVLKMPRCVSVVTQLRVL